MQCSGGWGGLLGGGNLTGGGQKFGERGESTGGIFPGGGRMSKLSASRRDSPQQGKPCQVPLILLLSCLGSEFYNHSARQTLEYLPIGQIGMGSIQ